MDCRLLFALKPRTYSRDFVKVRAVVCLLSGRIKAWAHRLLMAEDPVTQTWEAFKTAMDSWVRRSSASGGVRPSAVPRRPQRLPEETYRTTRAPSAVPRSPHRLVPPEDPPEETPASPIADVCEDEEEPMVLGCIQGMSPQSEQDRRRHLGLCFYCGDQGHYISFCPIRPPRTTHGSPRAHGATRVTQPKTGRPDRARYSPCVAGPVRSREATRWSSEPLLPTSSTKALLLVPQPMSQALPPRNPDPTPAIVLPESLATARRDPVPTSVLVAPEKYGDPETDELSLDGDVDSDLEECLLPYGIASDGMPILLTDMVEYEAKLRKERQETGRKKGER